MADRRHLLHAVGALALATLLQWPGAAEAQTYDLSGVAEDPALAARVPAPIREAGVLTIGSDNAYAPWEYLAGEDGQTPEGIDVDLAGAIGATLGLDVDFQTSAFDAIIPSLGTKFDLGVSALSVTEERMEVVDFVHYVDSGSLWAVLAGNPAGFNPADKAMRVIIPPTGNEAVGMLKMTSLVLAIPFTLDLMFATNAIANRIYLPVPLLMVAGFWYLLITSVLMVGQHYLERHYGRGHDAAAGGGH